MWTHSRVFLCLPSAVWPFPLAKPLGFKGTVNKGCISFTPTATEALALFIARETEVYYFLRQSTWVQTPRTSSVWRENRHYLTPERKPIHARPTASENVSRGKLRRRSGTRHPNKYCKNAPNEGAETKKFRARPAPAPP